MTPLMSQLVRLNLPANQAEKISTEVQNNLKKLSAEQCWQAFTKNNFAYPFAVHELVYKTIYPDWEKLPAPAWLPDEESIKTIHLAALMQQKKLQTYTAFHRWSVTHYQEFWQDMTRILNITFDQPYTALVDLAKGIEAPQWFPNAKLNIVTSCFQAAPSDLAIISQTECGETTKTTYEELNRLSNGIANSLSQQFKKGDKVAIIMPMTRYAIAIYLGIIKAGCVAVAIPDSFVADEIAVRLQISATKAVFCQDQIIRDGKTLPLYERVRKAQAPFTIVLSAGKKLTEQLRENDMSWDDFLTSQDHFTPISCAPNDHINILFSSGTTGAPKAIPWMHTAPIKAASDAYLHHNLKPHDIFCWPTNLGWMMGPWLIFACLLNKATIALYEGTPNSHHFGKFVQDTKVTHLGVVPTMVRTWRSTGNMEKLDLSAIKLFTSTGERSNTEDMLYLMFLANYRPIIEYCGGTEIAGAYITSTLMQPSAPAAFTTPACGLDFIIIDEQGLPTESGEVALIPPSIGLSTELLNKDHHEIYYADMPYSGKKILRRHGDQLRHYPNGFYRLLGRVDDTMKLGGIKISSAEIEVVLNALPGIYETAAIAFNPPDGGPSQLIIYTVLKANNSVDTVQIKTDMQNALKERLNPLFKIHEVIFIAALPRTASNKIMRRILRDEYVQSNSC